MSKPKYVYVTYIVTTPEKLWEALTNPEITRLYWGHRNVSDWKVGSKWEHLRFDEERTADVVGKVLESDPPRRLVTSWAYPNDAQNESQYSRVSFEIKLVAGTVRLRVTHTDLQSDTELADIAEGWPMVLSGLKTLLETGKPLPQLW